MRANLSDAEAARIAKTYYREITAICHNWNDLASDSFWQINPTGTERIEGLEGPVGPQLTHSADKRTNTPASSSMLRGGGIQVFLFPRSPFVCTPVNWGS